MTEQLSLLQEFRESGYEAAVLTTFNCHIPFLEDVVVRRLHGAGCRHIVILIDQDQLVRAVRADLPRRAGRDYHFLPVATLKAFHPKVFLLAGRAKGCLAVGSHNLTYAGLGSNREVTSALRFRSGGGNEHQATIQLAWDQVCRWILNASEGFDTEHRELLTKIEQLSPWLKDPAPTSAEDLRLVFGGPGNTSLSGEIEKVVRSPAQSLTICGAFFDSSLAMVKRLQEVLQPVSLTVAIDPTTVQIPSDAKELIKANFVKCDGLGLSNEGYLHAKFLYAIDAGGQHHLWVGSANPSAPAWLASNEAANHEAMVALSGSRAEIAAKALELQIIKKAAIVEPADWQALSERLTLQDATESDPPKLQQKVVIVSVNDYSRIMVELDGPAELHTFRFVDTLGKVYKGHVEISTVQGSYALINLIAVPNIAVIEVLQDKQVVRSIILHHMAELHEQARTGVQRRFRAALATLDSDSPDIADLFKCIESLVDGEEARASIVPRRNSAKTGNENETAPDTLEISIQGIGRTMSRLRLTAHSDLGYILDYLNRVLGQGLNTEFATVDLKGRSEEELVDSDDEVTESEARTEAKAEEILKLCHLKVRRLAAQVSKQMAAYLAGKVTDRVVINCTVAVLMLLRQLRGHDNHIWWVNTTRGETSVPDETLAKIAEAVTSAFLGHHLFAPVPKSDDTELLLSEEFGRVRGLLLWLAARIQLAPNFKPGFNETQVQRQRRLQMNADFLALSELIAGDPLAIEEASQSIKTTNASDSIRLSQALALHEIILELDSNFRSQSYPEPGDLAVHPELPELGIRVVLKNTGSYVDLAAPGGRQPKSYLASKLRYLDSSELSSRMMGL